MEGQLAKVAEQLEQLHGEMAAAASDYVRLAELQTRLADLEQRHADLEEEWLETATALEG